MVEQAKDYAEDDVIESQFNAAPPLSSSADDVEDVSRYGLVKTIKSLQSVSRHNSACWHEYIDKHGLASYDPLRHSSKLLQSFVKHFTQESLSAGDDHSLSVSCDRLPAASQHDTDIPHYSAANNFQAVGLEPDNDFADTEAPNFQAAGLQPDMYITDAEVINFQAASLEPDLNFRRRALSPT